MVFADTRPRVYALPCVTRVEDIWPRVPFCWDMQVQFSNLRALGAAEPKLFKRLCPFFGPMGKGFEFLAEIAAHGRQLVAVAGGLDQGRLA